MFTAWTATILVQPLFQAMVIKDLLTIIALHILFLDNVEADGAKEGVNKLLVRIHRVFFLHLVVASQFKHVSLSLFLDVGNEVFCFLLHIFFKPSTNSKRTLVVDGHSRLHSGSRNHYFYINQF